MSFDDDGIRVKKKKRQRATIMGDTMKSVMLQAAMEGAASIERRKGGCKMCKRGESDRRASAFDLGGSTYTGGFDKQSRSFIPRYSLLCHWSTVVHDIVRCEPVIYVDD